MQMPRQGFEGGKISSRKEDFVLPVAMSLLGGGLLWWSNELTNKCAVEMTNTAGAQVALPSWLAKIACGVTDWQVGVAAIIGVALLWKGVDKLLNKL